MDTNTNTNPHRLMFTNTDTNLHRLIYITLTKAQKYKVLQNTQPHEHKYKHKSSQTHIHNTY